MKRSTSFHGTTIRLTLYAMRLAPAEISKVIIDQHSHTMEVIVADDQLSLAIGKKGQNVRLAAKLTGWKIDVRSESKEEKISGESFERLLGIDDMDEETATMLFENGYRTPEDIAKATLAELRALWVSLKRKV